VALALGVRGELVLAVAQATESSFSPLRRPVTRPVSVRAAASARKTPVTLAPFSSMRTLPRLTFLSFTVTRTSASPPETM